MRKLPGLVLASLMTLGCLCTSRAASADGEDEGRAANPYVLHIPVCSATDMIIGDLDQIDAEKGLGRGGPVVSAVETLMRTSSAAPYQGVADLELVVNRNGSQTVHVLWAERRRSDWEGFVQGVEHLVNSDDVRIPEKALGMKIVVRVEARLVYSDNCAVRERSTATPFAGGYAMGCGTRPIAAPEPGESCRRRRRETATRVVHARILSEARIPDPAQPAQHVKT